MDGWESGKKRNRGEGKSSGRVGGVDLPKQGWKRSFSICVILTFGNPESWWARHTQNETLAQRRPSLQGNVRLPLHPCLT